MHFVNKITNNSGKGLEKGKFWSSMGIESGKKGFEGLKNKCQ
jgi:hypothetical protein